MVFFLPPPLAGCRYFFAPGLRSRNALEKLKTFTQPECTVIRKGEIEAIQSEDLVMGDSLMVEEGTSIAADGIIVHSNDFSVNESILTGESLPVYKDKTQEDKLSLPGHNGFQWSCYCNNHCYWQSTRLGKIGKSLESIKEEKTPLELQINNFVKKMVDCWRHCFLDRLGHQLFPFL